MSKDIRSYFSKNNGNSSGKTQLPSVQTKKRNRRVIDSDDDDDNLITANLLSKKHKEAEPSEKSKSPRKKTEVIVQVEDFFGSTPVLQTKQAVAVTCCKSINEENEKTSVKPEKSKLSGENKKSDGRKKNSCETLMFQCDDELEASIIIASDQKRKNAAGYQKYLNRSGAKNPGSKNIPKGTPTCLQGLTFVVTGVLDSLEREQATELIQKCGGRVTGQVSKKTDFLVIGEEPGVSKLDKAEKFGTKKITEDGLLNLICEKSSVEEEKGDNFIKCSPENTSKYFNENENRKRRKNVEEVKDELSEPSSKILKKEEGEKIRDVGTKPISNKRSPEQTKAEPLYATEEKEKEYSMEIKKTSDDMLWVDKYKPKSTKNILGQTGEKSNVKKLIKWLQNWHKFHSTTNKKKTSRPAPWNQNDDGSYYKAALLSGPPGVGKTTTIHLVCKELGLDIIEFNASDTRSKRLLQEEVSELLSTKSIRGFLKGSGDSYHKHVLVMDEVDGMAGSEDRGGIQELIQLIKNTKVPIVGICNDRSHTKMRSLVNYCYDLRFQRPRLEQIKGAMKSICFKENLDISGEALEELIINSNNDVRQVLHSLSLLVSNEKSLTVQEAKKSAEQAKKPMNLGPWDVVRKVFSESEQGKMSFVDKTDLFFQDYSLGPLFVQDSYLRVKPYKAKNCAKKTLELISKAAESLTVGDVIEKTIRSKNAWNLLPVQAIFSSVLPGHYMCGHMKGQIQFPAWLGKNSKCKKFDRLLQELHAALRLSVTGTKESINLDYGQHLKNLIVSPLAKQGIEGLGSSKKFMLEYNLTKDDLDHILELNSWPGVKDIFSTVDSKVKAALTRSLNKECQRVSHITKNKIRMKDDAEHNSEDGENEEDNEGENEEDNDENDNIDSDPLIKKGKPKKGKEDVTNKSSQTKKKTSKKEKH